MELIRYGALDYALPLSTDFASAIRPMVDIIADGWDLSGSATVHSAELELASRNHVCIRYKVKACHELARRERRQGAASHRGVKKRVAASDSSGSSNVDSSDSDNISDRSGSSIDSSVDVDAESDVEAEDSGGEDQADVDLGAARSGESDDVLGGAPWKRLARNSHTLHHNDYATFVDNRNFPNVKVVLRLSLCVAELLGTKNMSKTLYPEHFLEKRDSPVLSLLLLRAWVVYRLRAKRAFIDGHRARRRFVDAEVAALRVALPAHGVAEGRVRAGRALELLAEWGLVA